MKTVQTLLFCALLIPALALAQEESDTQSQAGEASQQADSGEGQSGSGATDQEASDETQGGEMAQPADEGAAAGEEQDDSMGQQDTGSASGEGDTMDPATQDPAATEGQDGATDQAAGGSSAGEAFMDEQATDQVRSAQLVGSPIVNAADEEIGTIDDLLLDEQGQVVGIIVGVGGFLGIGEKHVALAWEAVEIASGQDGNYTVKTEVDKAALEGATAFKTEEKQQQEQEQQQQQVEQQQQMEEQQQQMEQGEPQPEQQ